MPSPKDGTAVSVVPATEPTEAHDADTANPGEVETIKAQQRETGTGKYGTQPVDPYTPPETPEEKEVKKSWIEIVLVDEDDKPVPGEQYKVVLPDNKVKIGTLDAKGFARIDGIDDGNCQISFPKLDKDAWEPA
jgi:type VI secretion system secreted protein VgrG